MQCNAVTTHTTQYQIDLSRWILSHNPHPSIARGLSVAGGSVQTRRLRLPKGVADVDFEFVIFFLQTQNCTNEFISVFSAK